MFDKPVDHAWRAYQKVLKQSGFYTASDIAMALEAFKEGWHLGYKAGVERDEPADAKSL